jgi:hypothetical protein
MYLVTRNFKQWEIWAIPLDGASSAEVLYTLPIGFFWRQALDQGYLDPAVYAEFPEIQDQSGIQIKIFSYQLSPNNEFFAWVETFEGCTTYCTGQHAIKVLDIKQKKVIATYFTAEKISSITWSPGNDEIAFVETESYRFNYHPQINILELSSGQIVQTYPGANIISWDAGRLVAFYPTEITSGAGADVEACCQVISTDDQLVEFNNIEPYLNDAYIMDAAMDGRQLYLLTEAESLLKVISVNLTTSEIEQVQEYSFPDINSNWATELSPKGEYLMVRSSAENRPFSVYRNSTGELVWQSQQGIILTWTEDNSQLMVNRMKKSDSCETASSQLFIHNLKTGDERRVILPAEIQDFLDSDGSKMICPILMQVAW